MYTARQIANSTKKKITSHAMYDILDVFLRQGVFVINESGDQTAAALVFENMTIEHGKKRDDRYRQKYTRNARNLFTCQNR